MSVATCESGPCTCAVRDTYGVSGGRTLAVGGRSGPTCHGPVPASAGWPASVARLPSLSPHTVTARSGHVRFSGRQTLTEHGSLRPGRPPPPAPSPPHAPQRVSVQPTATRQQSHPAVAVRGRTRSQYHTPPPSHPPTPHSPSHSHNQPHSLRHSSVYARRHTGWQQPAQRRTRWCTHVPIRPSGTWPGWPQPQPLAATLRSCPCTQDCRHCWSGRWPSRWAPG